MTDILPADVFAIKNNKFLSYTRLHIVIQFLSTYKPTMTPAVVVIAISVVVNQCANLIGKTLLYSVQGFDVVRA